MCGEYISGSLDGTPDRAHFNQTCQWCGYLIPKGNLYILRHYTVNNRAHAAAQHLSCYDRTYNWCLEHGHTFTPYKMEPHHAIKLKAHLKMAEYHEKLNNRDR